MSAKPNAELVLPALQAAINERGPSKGLMFHSDQWSQYTSRNFQRLLWRNRFTQCMSRRGNYWDNVPMGPLVRSLRSEWMPPIGHSSITAAREDINDYLFGYYNWHRPHTFNGGVAPARAEKKLKMVSGFS